MNRKSFMNALLVTAAVISLDVNAALVTVPVHVLATANIWSSGHAAPESLTGGPGSISVLVNLPNGHDGTMTVTDVTGLIDYGPCCAQNDADGIVAAAGGGAAIDYRGIAGVLVERGRFFAGVFLDDSEPVDPPPSKLSIGNINFSMLSPGLEQSFFIGDGLVGTDSGSVQVFNIPINATRLYVGFHDSFNGLPGFFQDNSGSLNLNVNFNVVPVPAAVWLFGSGLIGLLGFARLKSLVSK